MAEKTNRWEEMDEKSIVRQKIVIDDSELKKTMKKVKHLRKLLKEVNLLADELTSKRIHITFRI